MRIHTCVYIHAYTYIHTYIYMYIYIYLYIYIYENVHTHTHTNASNRANRPLSPVFLLKTLGGRVPSSGEPHWGQYDDWRSCKGDPRCQRKGRWFCAVIPSGCEEAMAIFGLFLGRFSYEILCFSDENHSYVKLIASNISALWFKHGTSSQLGHPNEHPVEPKGKGFSDACYCGIQPPLWFHGSILNVWGVTGVNQLPVFSTGNCEFCLERIDFPKVFPVLKWLCLTGTSTSRGHSFHLWKLP